MNTDNSPSFTDSHDPLISVIIRTKDRPELLAEAVESVVQQDYRPIELVIVNDGGVDVRETTRDIAEQLDRIIHIRHEAWKGRSAAANSGMETATGNYIAFLDDDDLLLPGHFTALAREAKKGHTVIYSGIQCIRRGEDNQWRDDHLYNQPFDPVRLRVENYIPIHAVLFHRQFVENGFRFDDAFDTFEDWDFWVRLSLESGFRHVDEVTGLYRVDDTGGFGVAGSDERIQKGLYQFFGKWRDRWSTEQMLEVVEYAKYRSMYYELRQVLSDNDMKMKDLHRSWQESTDELARYRERHEDLTNRHQDLQDQKAAVHRQCNSLMQEKNSLIQQKNELVQEKNRLENEKTQLNRQKNSLETHKRGLQREKAALERQSARLAQTIEEIINSKSWRLTRPLRDFNLFMQRYPLRAYRVWKERGASVFAVALYQRITGRVQAPVKDDDLPRFTIPALPDQTGPMQFDPGDTPAVSLIIPLQPDARRAFALLESISKGAADGAAVEIIAVADENEAPWSETKGIRVMAPVWGETALEGLNRAAEISSGGILIFMDGRVVDPLENWIDRLADFFKTSDDLGIAGIRELHSDRVLSHAGGIVRDDGTLTPYGHMDHPCKPEYDYVREVDFCVSSLVAVRRAPFLELNGFDTGYAGFEYAAAHLSFAFRDMGWQTAYQPAVVGVGGRTWAAGNAVEDRNRFTSAWARKLTSHPPAETSVQRACRYGKQRHTLVIDAVMITPDQDSGSLRMFNLLAILQELGHAVTFVASNLELRDEYGRQLQQMGVEVLYAPFVYSIEKYLKDNGRRFDMVVVSRALVAGRYLEKVRHYAPDAFLLFDTVDLHFLRKTREADIKADPVIREEAERLKKSELALALEADMTLVVSRVEKELLEQECPELDVGIISNIHEIYGCKAGFDQREGLVFIGGFSHDPNVDAVCWFVNEIMPRVRRELGEIPVHIVGSHPPQEVLDLASDGVNVTGYVPDISGFFNQCRLSVAPLRYGAGVKGKVNMSMAYGLPVAATTMAAEGMFLKDGEDVLIGDDAREFASAVVRLYTDRELWQRISQRGLENLTNHFSVDAARKNMEKILAKKGLL